MTVHTQLRIHTRPALALGLGIGLLAAMAAAEGYEPPRDANGKPDLSGVWTNSSLTRLSRPDNISNLVLTPEEAEELSGSHFHNVRAAKDLEASDPNREAPDAVERLPGVGNYNAGWVDPGTAYGVVKGEIRSSWIVEPADGQVPYRPEVLEERGESRDLRASLSDPEVLSLGERCIIGFGGTGGPPMLNVLYNNYYRILQTTDHVMILVEMVHDARIIRLDSEHGPPQAGGWFGDSIGRWDGDTLVVESTNFHPGRQSGTSLPYSVGAVVTERFTRVSDSSILYEFTVDDPEHYTQPFRGEMSFTGVDDRLYEYACHEGNYAMPNILKGARLLESEAQEEK